MGIDIGPIEVVDNIYIQIDAANLDTQEKEQELKNQKVV